MTSKIKKTYEEIYGKEVALLKKKNISDSLKRFYESEKGKQLKQHLSKVHKGKSKPGTSKAMKGIKLVDRIGKVAADEQSKRTIAMNKARSISKEDIINRFLEAYNKYGPFAKSDFDKFVSVHSQTARNKFGSLDELARQSSVRFKIIKHRTTGGIGKNEIDAREWYQRKTGHDIIPNFKVITDDKKYIVDWFDVTDNRPVEFDEPHHKYRLIEDVIRENSVLKTLKCNSFLRIKEKDFLNKLSPQTNFSDFSF